MNSIIRRLRGRRLTGLTVVITLTVGGALVLLDPGSNGPVPTLADWVTSDTFRGTMLALGSASLVAGVISGLLTLGVARFRGYSWAPVRVVAARLLRRPYERVSRTAATVVHLLLSVAVLFVLGAVYLGGSILFAVFGPPPVSMLGGGLIVAGSLLLVTIAVGWWVVTRRWLPAATRQTGGADRQLRRQAAVILATYAVVAVFTYPLVLFVTMMLVFFR